MFKECRKCELGMECNNDYASLKSGYWWRWRNETYKYRYRYFIQNLLTSLPALREEDVQYLYPIPTPYRCPLEESCGGSLDSLCKNGYKGPLCSVCSLGYYKQLQKCKRCPSKTWIGGQLSIIAAIFIIIIGASLWKSKKNNQNDDVERSLTHTFLSKIKIVIGFYQVTYGLLEAFSYIKWPDSLQVISKYSEILQLNILQMAPAHCLSPRLHVDAFTNLFVIMTVNVAVIGFAVVAYGVCKFAISRKGYLGDEAKAKKVSQAKELVYRNLFFFLYVTYLSTCSNTASALPLACRKLCLDDKDSLCSSYLKADYSIQCHDLKYSNLVIVAYISVAYIIALPVTTFIALWKQRRAILATADNETSGDAFPSDEMVTGLRFLFESYKARSWYWELIEMSRKVMVTSGLILLGQETRSYIGLAWVVAGMYGVLFSWTRPLQDAFENRLMTTSIAVTVVNLGIGAVSKIPAENLPASTNSYMDSVIFNILVLGANSVVIGMLVCRLSCFKIFAIKLFIKEILFKNG